MDLLFTDGYKHTKNPASPRVLFFTLRFYKNEIFNFVKKKVLK